MIIFDNRQYVLTRFESEDELDDLVVENADHIFGPSSVYLSKSLIRTTEGTGTIPDGYAIDLEKRQWYLVEAEISQHSVWSHIAPQVAKQIIAAGNPESKQKIVEAVISRIRDDDTVEEKFAEQGIDPIDYRHVLGEIVARDPIIGMPIDDVKPDLRDWAATLKVDVRLWIVQKYTDYKNPSEVAYKFPDEFQPAFETSPRKSINEGNATRYDVAIVDLIQSEILHAGQQLHMRYKPRNGEQQQYKATIQANGSLQTLGHTFPAPSFAALRCINAAGSNRTTVNGWTAWRTEQGATLADLREDYLKMRLNG